MFNAFLIEGRTNHLVDLVPPIGANLQVSFEKMMLEEQFLVTHN